jgi:hypothetical protein
LNATKVALCHHAAGVATPWELRIGLISGTYVDALITMTLRAFRP